MLSFIVSHRETLSINLTIYLFFSKSQEIIFLKSVIEVTLLYFSKQVCCIFTLFIIFTRKAKPKDSHSSRNYETRSSESNSSDSIIHLIFWSILPPYFKSATILMVFLLPEPFPIPSLRQTIRKPLLLPATARRTPMLPTARTPVFKSPMVVSANGKECPDFPIVSNRFVQ